jgi:hypothetical protein
MSLTKLVFPVLHWSELWEVLSFLSIREVYKLGSTCRSGFITFLREKVFREGLRLRSSSSPMLYHARFLSKYSSHEKVLLVSYPRSGNSYVRKMLELRTGIITGSDSRPNRVLSASLLKYGYYGEGITDQSVWVVKSHYPERLGYIKFPVHRIILVVRNPFDAIESYFHMAMTNTHDKVLSSEVRLCIVIFLIIDCIFCQSFVTLETLWKEFLRNEAKVWKEFHRYWISLSDRLPMTIVRYEDLLSNEEVYRCFFVT